MAGVHLVAAYGFAVAFLFIGLWGRRNVDDLVPTALSEKGRAKKRRVLWRGATASVVVAMFLVGFATSAVIERLLA